MAKAIFKVLFSIILSIINAVLLPINLVINGIFPDLSVWVTKLDNMLPTYFYPTIKWFSYMLPTDFKALFLVYLSLLMTYYSVNIAIHLIVKIFTIVKNIKVW